MLLSLSEHVLHSKDELAVEKKIASKKVTRSSKLDFRSFLAGALFVCCQF